MLFLAAIWRRIGPWVLAALALLAVLAGARRDAVKDERGRAENAALKDALDAERTRNAIDDDAATGDARGKLHDRWIRH